MAIWPRWAQRCTAHSSRTGLPCRAWAVTGCRTCRAHGSATQAAKDAGLARAQADRVIAKAARQLARGLARDMARWEALTGPERRAEGMAILRELEAELAEGQLR